MAADRRRSQLHVAQDHAQSAGANVVASAVACRLAGAGAVRTAAAARLHRLLQGIDEPVQLHLRVKRLIW